MVTLFVLLATGLTRLLAPICSCCRPASDRGAKYAKISGPTYWMHTMVSPMQNTVQNTSISLRISSDPWHISHLWLQSQRCEKNRFAQQTYLFFPTFSFVLENFASTSHLFFFPAFFPLPTLSPKPPNWCFFIHSPCYSAQRLIHSQLLRKLRFWEMMYGKKKQ